MQGNSGKGVSQIILTQGYVTLIDEEDFEEVSKHSWCVTQSSVESNLYAFNGRLGRLHRFLMKPDKGKVVDHKNGDTLDNRKENLRVCTVAENSRYRKITENSNKTSKFKGVYLHKQSQKFHARIRFNRAYISLGYFKDESDAAEAYNKKSLEIYGEFAYLNNTKIGEK